MKIGDRVRTYGLVGGPLPGKIIARGESRGCWIVRVKIGKSRREEEIHEDHLKTRKEYLEGRNIE